MLGRVRGACPTRRSRADIAAIRAAILDIIGDDPPMPMAGARCSAWTSVPPKPRPSGSRS